MQRNGAVIASLQTSADRGHLSTGMVPQATARSLPVFRFAFTTVLLGLSCSFLQLCAGAPLIQHPQSRKNTDGDTDSLFDDRSDSDSEYIKPPCRVARNGAASMELDPPFAWRFYTMSPGYNVLEDAKSQHLYYLSEFPSAYRVFTKLLHGVSTGVFVLDKNRLNQLHLDDAMQSMADLRIVDRDLPAAPSGTTSAQLIETHEEQQGEQRQDEKVDSTTSQPAPEPEANDGRQKSTLSSLLSRNIKSTASTTTTPNSTTRAASAHHRRDDEEDVLGYLRENFIAIEHWLPGSANIEQKVEMWRMFLNAAVGADNKLSAALEHNALAEMQQPNHPAILGCSVEQVEEASTKAAGVFAGRSTAVAAATPPEEQEEAEPEAQRKTEKEAEGNERQQNVETGGTTDEAAGHVFKYTLWIDPRRMSDDGSGCTTRTPSMPSQESCEDNYDDDNDGGSSKLYLGMTPDMYYDDDNSTACQVPSRQQSATDERSEGTSTTFGTAACAAARQDTIMDSETVEDAAANNSDTSTSLKEDLDDEYEIVEPESVPVVPPFPAPPGFRLPPGLEKPEHPSNQQMRRGIVSRLVGRREQDHRTATQTARTTKSEFYSDTESSAAAHNVMNRDRDNYYNSDEAAKHDERTAEDKSIDSGRALVRTSNRAPPQKDSAASCSTCRSAPSSHADLPPAFRTVFLFVDAAARELYAPFPDLSLNEFDECAQPQVTLGSSVVENFRAGVTHGELLTMEQRAFDFRDVKGVVNSWREFPHLAAITLTRVGGVVGTTAAANLAQEQVWSVQFWAYRGPFIQSVNLQSKMFLTAYHWPQFVHRGLTAGRRTHQLRMDDLLHDLLHNERRITVEKRRVPTEKTQFLQTAVTDHTVVPWDPQSIEFLGSFLESQVHRREVWKVSAQIEGPGWVQVHVVYRLPDENFLKHRPGYRSSKNKDRVY
ncbi:unnamed protein product [Amoebophrya sp. A120]|nr:unnamed protein product [Amoebophrya sp. A120]|eukprot:GSA120T00021595001.1